MKAKPLALALLALLCAASARSQVVWEGEPGRLVPGTINGVDATNDVTVNATLQRGFFLTGTILEPLNEGITNICAVSTTTSTCFEANFTTSGPSPAGYTVTYSVVLPPDTYNLKVVFIQATGESGPTAQFTYIDPTSPAPFTVSSDTARDFTIPTVTPSTITGTVSNLNPAITGWGISFDSTTVPGFSDVRGGASGAANGNYSAYLPSGTFNVQLSQYLVASTVTSSLGSFAVSGPLNFTVPTFSTATLSGTVIISGSGSYPANTFLFATDTTSGPPPTTFSSGGDKLSGYSLTLGTGDTYALSLQGPQGIPVQILPSPAQLAYFNPPPVQVPGSLTSNTTFNPVFPAPSGSAIAVTISGRLTVAGTNTPVPGAFVYASGNQIIGAPYTSSGGSATTDPNGNFSFIVPAGTNYTLSFYGALVAPGDFDGDGKTDYSVFRPSDGGWYVKENGSNLLEQQWGTSGDIPVPGRYLGGVESELAVWRPSNGFWYVHGKSAQQWGTFGDTPVPGDYDGDGKTDLAVWRPSEGNWYIIPSSNPGTPIVQNWGTSGDIPVPGDYDGDGKADFAVWRPSTGQWFIIPSSNPGAPIIQPWGTSGDVPVPGDYDGDGKTDIAVWRPSNGQWFIIPSSNPATPIIQQWGTSGDILVPGDYDGDGTTDIAVWRPSNGQWFIIPSSNPATPIVQQWGTSGDIPSQKPIGQ